MNTKHTPGPWNFQPCDEYANCFDVLCEKDYYVATTHDGVRGDRNADANARLIAAAPDLLKALQWYEAKAVQMGRAAIDQDSKLLLGLIKEIAVEYGAQARAAIAKATGDQL
jgi:hypothetical protein